MGQSSGFPRGTDSGGANLIASIPTILSGSYNGSGVSPSAVSTAAILASATQNLARVVTGPGQWAIESSPGVNGQATITRAAGGAGVRHICQAFLVTLSNNGAAASTQTFVVRDGPSGGGTILWEGTIAIPAVSGSQATVTSPPLNLLGSPNTAMTIEFTAAGGANTFESVNMSGYDTV